MLYIKENSRELIEEYLEDIIYLETNLKAVEVAKRHTTEFMNILILIEDEEGRDQFESVVQDIEYKELSIIKNEIIEHFKSTTNNISFDSCWSIDEYAETIQTAIDVLKNRIMAILKRSR